MDDVTILGRDDERRIFKEFEAQYGAPAFVRRARETEQALELLLERCRRQRDEWLGMTRTRLGMLGGLAGRWEAVRPLLADDDQVTLLAELERLLQPRLRVPVQPTSSARVLRRALTELLESLECFNRRWLEYLAEVDLSRINELRDGYNRYYLLEKECAVRSARVAREGFVRLPSLTSADLVGLLPPLPVPRRA